MAQQIKNTLAIQETQEMWVWSLGQMDPLEMEMATHSSILALKESHGQRSLLSDNPWGRKKSDTTEPTRTHSHVVRWSNIKIYIYIYLFLATWVFIAARGLLLVVASESYTLVSVCGLLITVASLTVDHRLQVCRFSSCSFCLREWTK